MRIKFNNIFKDNKLKNQSKLIKKNKEQNIDEKENIEEFEIEIDLNENINTDKEKNKKENEKKYKEYFSNFFKNKNHLEKSYYFLFIAMLGLGTGSVYIAGKTYNLFTKEDYAIYTSNQSSIDTAQVFNNEDKSSENSVVEQENNVTNKDTKEITNINSTTKTTSVAKIEKKQEVPKIEPLKFAKPISGDVQKIYSIDKVIYSKTLDLWKTHDGIDIKANIGDKVKSIERGTVERVYEDSFYGISILIDHGDGYKSCYSNLDADVSVKEKQVITKGKIIGKISNTAIGEIKDDPHLHFTLLKDGKIVDPSSIFK